MTQLHCTALTHSPGPVITLPRFSCSRGQSEDAWCSWGLRGTGCEQPKLVLAGSNRIAPVPAAASEAPACDELMVCQSRLCVCGSVRVLGGVIGAGRLWGGGGGGVSLSFFLFPNVLSKLNRLFISTISPQSQILYFTVQKSAVTLWRPRQHTILYTAPSVPALQIYFPLRYYYWYRIGLTSNQRQCTHTDLGHIFYGSYQKISQHAAKCFTIQMSM